MGEKTTIDPKEVYFLYTVHRNGWIGWVKSFPTLVRYVERGQLKATIVSTGENKKARRYFVKGADLIAFIDKFDSGRIK